ncbi:MAG: hypothetical protein GXP16_08260 [Gammaproteobacteria bacterium]|nr:hypothetical protein [Gammaproteobacteria bacterium]
MTSHLTRLCLTAADDTIASPQIQQTIHSSSANDSIPVHKQFLEASSSPDIDGTTDDNTTGDTASNDLDPSVLLDDSDLED